MTKTMTKGEIRKEAKKVEKELRKLYNRLDNLMDDAETSALAMNDKQRQAGKADELNTIANIIQAARDYTQIAYDDLQSV